MRRLVGLVLAPNLLVKVFSLNPMPSKTEQTNRRSLFFFQLEYLCYLYLGTECEHESFTSFRMCLLKHMYHSSLHSSGLRAAMWCGVVQDIKRASASAFVVGHFQGRVMPVT